MLYYCCKDRRNNHKAKINSGLYTPSAKLADKQNCIELHFKREGKNTAN